MKIEIERVGTDIYLSVNELEESFPIPAEDIPDLILALQKFYEDYSERQFDKAQADMRGS